MIAPALTTSQARQLRQELPGGDREMDWRHGREKTERSVYRRLKIQAANGGTIEMGRFHSRRIPLSSLTDAQHWAIARETVRVATEEAMHKHREDELLRKGRRGEAF